MLYIFGQRKRARPRTLLLIAAYSGLGFGVAEGLFYSSDYYAVGAPISIYIQRFFGVALAHAAWTMLSTGALMLVWQAAIDDALRAYRNGIAEFDEQYLSYAWRTWLVVVLFAVAVPAIPHALYDSFLVFDLGLFAAIVEALVATSAVLIAFCIPDDTRLFLPLIPTSSQP